jgi:hypothetical protein
MLVEPDPVICSWGVVPELGSATMLHDDPNDLKQAISLLRQVLASETQRGLTTEYLVQLQDAIEVADRAVRAERWARDISEFQGE